MWIEYENEYFNLDAITNIRKTTGEKPELILMASGKEIKKIKFDNERKRNDFIEDMLEIKAKPLKKLFR